MYSSLITLLATGGNSYTWDNSVTQGVPFTPASTNTYTVTVSNGFCSATDNIIVTLATPPSTPVIYQTGNILNSTSSTGNQWYNDSGIITGATSQIYTPVATSHYYCIVTDANGCISLASNIIYVVITGLTDLSDNKNIYLYPNPANDNLQIQTELKIKTIEITDIAGRLIYTSSSKTINCGSFAKGVYFVKIEMEKETVVKKFIKE